MHSKILLSLIALAVSAQTALAAQPPNLSGTWLVQSERSEFGSIPAPAIHKDVIEHRDSSVRITRTILGQGGETTTTLVFVVDGRVHSNRAGSNELTSVLTWDGPVLVIRSTVMTAQGAVTITDRVTVSPDRNTMTLTRLFSLGGQDAMQKLVFARQE